MAVLGSWRWALRIVSRGSEVDGAGAAERSLSRRESKTRKRVGGLA